MLVENYTADTKMETESHRSNTCGKYGQMMAATAAEKHDTTDLVINYCPDYDRCRWCQSRDDGEAALLTAGD